MGRCVRARRHPSSRMFGTVFARWCAAFECIKMPAGMRDCMIPSSVCASRDVLSVRTHGDTPGDEEARVVPNATINQSNQSTMGMRRSDSLSHVESAMSSVKSLRGRGLDLPHTGRWLRRKHRCVVCLFRFILFVAGASRWGCREDGWFCSIALRLDRAGRSKSFTVVVRVELRTCID